MLCRQALCYLCSEDCHCCNLFAVAVHIIVNGKSAVNIDERLAIFVLYNIAGVKRTYNVNEDGSGVFARVLLLAVHRAFEDNRIVCDFLLIATKSPVCANVEVLCVVVIVVVPSHKSIPPFILFLWLWFSFCKVSCSLLLLYYTIYIHSCQEFFKDI